MKLGCSSLGVRVTLRTFYETLQGGVTMNEFREGGNERSSKTPAETIWGFAVGESYRDCVVESNAVQTGIISEVPAAPVFVLQ